MDDRKIQRLITARGVIRVIALDDGSVVERSGGSVSWRNNNPGNLKFEFRGSSDRTVGSTRSKDSALVQAQRRYSGIVGLDQWGNAVFESYEAGRAAKLQLLERRHGSKTVEQMLLSYSTADYTGGTHHQAQADFIFRQADRSGLNLRGKTIQQMDGAELAALADGIKGFEGWKVGETHQLSKGEQAKTESIVVADNAADKRSASPPHISKHPVDAPIAHAHAPEIASAEIGHADHRTHDSVHVESVQRSLRELGYRSTDGHQLIVDGAQGPRTHHAILAFQQAHHLHPDGIVGKHTLAALEHARDSPLLSEATHPQHGLYVQALHGVHALPGRTFGSVREQHNAAATLTVAAHAAGLRRIDHVVLGTDAVRLFAVEGRMDDPAHRRVHVDRVQAVVQSVEQGTRAMERAAVQEPLHSHAAFVAMQEQVDHRGAALGIRP